MANAKTNALAPENKLLSRYAQGYSQNELIGTKILPIVNVDKSKGLTIPLFPKEVFKAVNAKRAPGAPVPSGEMDVPTTTKIDLDEYSWKFGVDKGDLEDGDVLEHKKRATNQSMRVLLNGREQQIADAVFNDANFPVGSKTALAGTEQWTDAASDPYEQIMDYKQTVENKIGITPNKLTLGNAAARALKMNTKLRKYITDANMGLTTWDIIKELLEVDEIIIGTGKKVDDAGVISDIWGDSALLSYVNVASRPDKNNPSFGYTFNRKGYPRVRETEDLDENVIFPTAYLKYKLKVLSYDAAFLMTNTNA